ncbi:MAG: helix-turn-helix domain-containing protein [Rhodospirillales bacterium]|nr:helix-turn-helix domain-containing protein [Rhodospirillales bacterium]
MTTPAKTAKTKRTQEKPLGRTPAGRRLEQALKEVLADVWGTKALPVVARVPDAIDVRRVRQGTGLSQAEFAARFGINRRTLQDWEQGRHEPDAMARALLTIIAREPEAVRRALAA